MVDCAAPRVEVCSAPLPLGPGPVVRLVERPSRILWRRVVVDDEEETTPATINNQEPEPTPLQGVLDPFRSCWRRTARSVMDAAGLNNLPREPSLLWNPKPPWDSLDCSNVDIRPDMPRGASTKAPPTIRRTTAQITLAALPPADTLCWTDRSAKEAVKDGGGGTLIILPDGTKLERRAPAGALCSSYRAELTAMRLAFEAILELPRTTWNIITSIRLCSDSRSAIQHLQGGPLAQSDVLATDASHHGGRP
jgi:hypothetical protein